MLIFALSVDGLADSSVNPLRKQRLKRIAATEVDIDYWLIAPKNKI